jgi:predicted protein tyrosine phosphatase
MDVNDRHCSSPTRNEQDDSEPYFQDDYLERLSVMTLLEENRFNAPMILHRDAWWYCRGFAEGLLLIDKMDTDIMDRRLDYLLELVIEFGDALVPAVFSIGLKDAMILEDLPPQPLPVCNLSSHNVLDRCEQLRRASSDLERLLDVTQPTLHDLRCINTTPRQPVQTRTRMKTCLRPNNTDEITFIKICRGHLAIRPRPTLPQLRVWKPDILVSLSESRPGTKRMRQLHYMVQAMQSVEWVPLQLNILSCKAKATLTPSDFTTLKYVDVLLEKLAKGKKIVVHCHAGLHRSGFFVYILLRRHGMSETHAVKALRMTRRRTFNEMTAYSTRRRLTLAQIAEGVFASLSFGSGG